jgi:hypothetical protein
MKVRAKSTPYRGWAVILLSLFFVCSGDVLGAPANDDFENRTALSGYPLTVSGSTSDATAQSGDPIMYLYSHGATVWYSWTAPASGWLSVAANNLTGNPLIPRFCVGLFTGSQLASLKKIAGGQDGTGALVTGGQTYVIGVDGDQGDFELALNFLPRPANDNFANRLVLSGAIVATTNNNAPATIEKGEPIPAKGMANASLWYQWTAPAAGLVRVIAEGDGFVPVISVYQGTTLKNLKKVANSLNMKDTVDVLCSFQAKAGNTYVISVDGLNPDGRGQIVLGVDLTTLVITNPLSGAAISAAAPPFFR